MLLRWYVDRVQAPSWRIPSERRPSKSSGLSAGVGNGGCIVRLCLGRDGNLGLMVTGVVSSPVEGELYYLSFAVTVSLGSESGRFGYWLLYCPEKC